MPRRTAPRCSRLRTSEDQIDEIVELNLCFGDCFGAWDLRRRVEFARPWSRWGNEITRRWSAAFPGSRPFALYVLGEIPAPAWQHELPGLRRPFRAIEGGTVAMLDTGWHQGRAEFQRLDELGLVDADEKNRAVQRLASDDATYHGRYRPLSRDQRTATAACQISRPE